MSYINMTIVIMVLVACSCAISGLRTEQDSEIVLIQPFDRGFPPPPPEFKCLPHLEMTGEDKHSYHSCTSPVSTSLGQGQF